jgi:hypothetical protein
MTTPPRPEGPLASTFKVKVTSVPPGARVWVEDEPRPRGRTPLQLEFVSLGPKPLRLVAPGFEAATENVWIGRESAAHVVLRPAAGGKQARARGHSPTPYQRVED